MFCFQYEQQGSGSEINLLTIKANIEYHQPSSAEVPPILHLPRATQALHNWPLLLRSRVKVRCAEKIRRQKDPEGQQEGKSGDGGVE